MPGPSRVVTSVRNPGVVEARRLHDARRRRDSGRTLVEGPHQLADAAAAGAIVHEIYARPGDPEAGRVAASCGREPIWVNEAVLGALSGTRTPRGPIGVVKIPDPVPLTGTDTVVLWEVSEPGNAGAVVRSAAAFGFAVATVGGADIWAPGVIRAAAATQFGVPVTRLGADAVGALGDAGLTPLALVAGGGEDLAHVAADAGLVALLVGNEAHGLPADVGRAATPVTIPMPGAVESLNAAVAAGIALYVLSSRHHPPSGTQGSRRR